MNGLSSRGQPGPFSCHEELSCMISSVGEVDTEPLILCQEPPGVVSLSPWWGDGAPSQGEAPGPLVEAHLIGLAFFSFLLPP